MMGLFRRRFGGGCAQADDGLSRDPLSSRDRAELAELRREKRDLRRRNAILKGGEPVLAAVAQPVFVGEHRARFRG